METMVPNVPATPDAAAEIFGDSLELAEQYCRLLAGSGTLRGLIGPRETPRLWERHLLNCAVVAEAIDANATVGDVGSGAGLPGIPIAIARPDLHVTLIEPLQRRTTWLAEVLGELGLDSRVDVVRSRAEGVTDLTFDVVTSRAVAALEALAPVSLPLLRPQGVMLAMKGDRAEEELAATSSALPKWGAQEWDVLQLGIDVLATPTQVVRVRVGEQTAATRRSTRRRSRNR